MTVDSWGKRYAAAEAAHRVRGVLDIANDIAVKTLGTPGRTDTEIAGAVRNALVWDVFVPDTRIWSTVSNGVVTLEGDVETWTQHDDAAKAVRNLSGVREVVNLIGIKAPRVDAAKVRKSIEDALERRAEREAKRVSFEIQDGHVKVSGTVRSWGRERNRDGSGEGHPRRPHRGGQAPDRGVLLAAGARCIVSTADGERSPSPRQRRWRSPPSWSRRATCVRPPSSSTRRASTGGRTRSQPGTRPGSERKSCRSPPVTAR